MRIGIPSETAERERRVAVTPSGARTLTDAGHEVVVESGAGTRAGFGDDAYGDAGAAVVGRADAIGSAGVIVQVDGPGADDLNGSEWSDLGGDHLLVGLHDPLGQPERAEALAATGATAISLELIPRTTKAQAMDVLSSMATVAGYQAVLLGAARIPKMVPMLMTAAGTVPPSRFLVLGAGVAGLQALATARRLGGVVEGYDVRPAAQEQIRSLGAKAIELDLDTSSAEGAGGYATEQSDDQARRQLDLLAPHVADADVVITTAAVPGATSPELVTREMIDAMRPGSVIVDLAAGRGGNTRLTRPDEEVEHAGVIILGPTDLASRAPATSSQMFSTNVLALLRHLAPDGDPVIDLDDEIIAGTVLTHDGDVRHPAVRERLGLVQHAGKEDR
ncbi:MAG: NAD(P) transhydrogenase subunit alpha [Actinomycetota bacterium]